MHTKNIIEGGSLLTAENKVLIMLHGRGASAEDILGLAQHLDVKGFTLLAPQATNNTWYPFSFLAPTLQNEPWLSSAINILSQLVKDVQSQGVVPEHIYFAGFSQGACLTLEFVARHAQRYGGVIAFTGALIGETVDVTKYSGNFNGTPIFIGTSDPDPHVPVDRVHETTKVLTTMDAVVTEKVYPGMGHTISMDEIDTANKVVFGTNNNH